MVHRPSDSRLLNSLLSNEKEYHKQLLALVDNYSQHSLTAFAAYASASPAPVARAVIAVAGSFAGADDALRRYAGTVEAWQAELRALRELEEEVGNVMRDREIFVTRLIKLSKHQKPTRDTFIGTLGSSVGDASQISLNSFTSATASSSKLGSAQAELQACEAHLAAKEKELDERRVSAVRRGLEARCKAMVECGWSWGEMGKEGLRALEGIESVATNGIHVSPHKPLPDPDRTPGSDLSSIGPSQSASQIYLPTSPLSVPPDEPTPTLQRMVSPAPVPPRSSSPLPMPPAAPFTLQIPPAHAISELALPSTLDGPIDEEPEDLEQGSSEEDSRPVEVVENARFATSATGANVGRRLSLRPPRARDGSNTTSSGTGTGTGSFSQPSSIALAPPRRSISLSTPERERKTSGGFFSTIAGLFRGGSIGGGHSGGSDKWKMRTETNLRAVRRDEDTSSEDEDHNESPTRRFFHRRTSHDIPRPSSPTPQKLRKRNVPEEKEKDQGWISDGAAVRGRGARKGSTRKRSALPGTPSRPSHFPPSTSAHSRSSSVASMGWSAVSTPGSLTPTPTPTRAKPSPKPKTDLRVEALSRSSADVSRQSSLRSTGSAVRTPRRLNYTDERAAGLPSSAATPTSGVGRKASLGHGKSASVTYPSAPLHADVGLAGSSQMSLLAIVEGVTKDNRDAWERAGAGLPPAPAGSTSKLDGLLSVRAPPSVTKYNLRGEGGQGIAFESVLAPGSVLATPPPAFSSSTRQRPSSLPPPPRVPIAATSPGLAPKVPLRSALRNHSPAPLPPRPPPKPIVVPSAPPRVIIESDTAPAQTQTPNGKNHHKDDDNDDGSDSGGSFRTVRESLEEETTPTLPPTTVTAPSSSSLVIPGQNDSDVSGSSNSAGAGAGAGTRRRKSVRVSLKPTFSPSPPALDEDEDEIWKRSGRPEPPGGGTSDHDDNDDYDHDRDKRNGWINGGARDRDRERDFWADSSDEDEEYSKARRMLTRTSKKRW